MLVPPVEDRTGLVLSFYKVPVQNQILHKTPNGGEFYPASGFQYPASIPASTTTNQLLHLRFSVIPFKYGTSAGKAALQKATTELQAAWKAFGFLLQPAVR